MNDTLTPTEVLSKLKAGYTVNRQIVIAALEDILTPQQQANNTPPSSRSERFTEQVLPGVHRDDNRIHPPKTEATPRVVVVGEAGWKYGECKRCLAGPETCEPGDRLVKVQETGWWHAYCYYLIRPDFFIGMPTPAFPRHLKKDNGI